MHSFPATCRIAVLLVAASFLSTCKPAGLFAQHKSAASKRQESPRSDIRSANRPRVSSSNHVAGSDAFRPRNPNETPATVVAGGFCLVSLRDHKTWVPGDPNIQLILNKKLYRFAGIRQRDIFAASPETYLPVLEGDSIVAFADTGQRAPSDLEFGLTYRNRLYFFRSAVEQAEFQTHPDSYANTDLVDQGYCPVSKVEEQKLVLGVPETVMTLDGLRYMFASAGHRRSFAANPQRYVDSTNATFHDLQVRNGINPNQSYPGFATKKNEAASSKEQPSTNDEAIAEVENYTRPAMSGYCPVSIEKEGVWVRGKSRFKAVFDGKVYHMAGSEEQSLFRENPRAFVPVLGGDSVVAFADESRRVTGSAYHPLIAGGRLFLFADAAEKEKFKEDPALYENADLAFGGNCILTLTEQHREEPGLPDMETVFQGLRYRFASQALQEKFLTEPEVYVDQLSVAQ